MLEGRSAGEYMAGHTSYVRREPIGVCGQVTPWNYPLMMAIWKIAPALAAGNTRRAQAVGHHAGLHAAARRDRRRSSCRRACSTWSAATGTPAARWSSHPTPQMVSITGSTRAGMEVAAAAAPDLKRTHLELGGKAPVVVFDDADVAAAAEAIAVAGYFNAGQDCTAATRVLAGPRHPRRLRRRADRAGPRHQDRRAGRRGRALRPAEQRQPARPGRRLRRPAARPRRRLAIGGGRVGDRGFFYAPTVVSGLRQDDEIIQDEVFGPVITVQRFTDEDEAVRWANGVAVRPGRRRVWTKDHGRAMRMTRRLDFGCVWVNTHIPFVAEMPHGGFKHSGHGKDLSMYGLEDYTRIKHVMSYIGTLTSRTGPHRLHRRPRRPMHANR